MKARVWTSLAAALLLTVAGATVGLTQPPRDNHQEHHQQAAENGEQANRMAMMPMMMQMHQRHAAMANDWVATDEAVFVLRGGQVLKYGEDLKLVKTIDLPQAEQEPQAAGDQEPQQQMQQRMQQMMARMHGALPARIEVTEDAVWISHGQNLLKFDEDLNLETQAKLPALAPASAMKKCAMCREMMQRMREQKPDRGHHGGRDK